MLLSLSENIYFLFSLFWFINLRNSKTWMGSRFVLNSLVMGFNLLELELTYSIILSASLTIGFYKVTNWDWLVKAEVLPKKLSTELLSRVIDGAWLSFSMMVFDWLSPPCMKSYICSVFNDRIFESLFTFGGSLPVVLISLTPDWILSIS